MYRKLCSPMWKQLMYGSVQDNSHGSTSQHRLNGMPSLKELESRQAETRKKKVKDAKDRLPDN
jgi:hypothetical protein